MGRSAQAGVTALTIAVLAVAAACYDPRAGGGAADGGGGADGVLTGDAGVVIWPDATCLPPTNDTAVTAFHVTSDASLCFLLEGAQDDAEPGCTSGPGGRDVYVQLDLPGSQVVYVDTIGSSTQISILLIDGPCDASAALLGCYGSNCGAAALGAVKTASPTTCLVIDETSATGGSAHAVVHILPTGVSGDALALGSQTLQVDTCATTNQVSGGCGMAAPADDVSFYLPVCLEDRLNIRAQTGSCLTSARTLLLTLWRDRPPGLELACASGECSTLPAFSEPVTGPGLFWVVADGAQVGDCGQTELDVEVTAL